MKYLEVAALRPGRLLALAVAVTLLLGGAWLGAASESQSTPDEKNDRKKLEPPGPIDQADYEKLIRNLSDLKKDFAAAEKDRAAAGTLAAKLAKWAAVTKSPGGRFVALRLTRTLAIQASDLKLALEAIQALDSDYAIDADELRFETLKAVGKDTPMAMNRLMVLEALALVGNPKLPAQTLFELAAVAAARSHHTGLSQRVQLIRKLYQQAQTEAGPYQKALELLAKNPNDGPANLLVGKHLCLLLGNWEKGLRHLVLGNHLVYKLIARNDLKRPTEPDRQHELGDDWWELAQTVTGDQRYPLQYRAGAWYEKALSGLKGAAAAVVKNRLAEVDQLAIVLGPSKDTPEVLDTKQYLDIQAHEGDPRLKAATMRFGLALPGQPFPGKPGELKRLTFDSHGLSNNTCLKVEGVEQLLGLNGGRWQVRKETLDQNRIGFRSVWVTDDLPIRVTQTIELVRGAQTRKLDTCKVLYTMENTSKKKDYLVGLRFLLDTFIGTNDGAPFIIPGEGTLCETSRDLKGAQVPTFVQALEYPFSLHKPGTVASLHLKIGGGVEAPQQVTLGAWPNPESREPGANGPGTLWKVPLFSMKKLLPPDSAAVLYWDEKALAPGAKREVGFSYGLGNFAANPDGRLGLIVGGGLHAGGTVEVVALVVVPTQGQQVTLTVSEGLQIVGKPMQVVPQPPAGVDNPIVPVTWKVQANSKGLMNFRVVSTAGATASQDVRLLEKPVAPPPPMDVTALTKADLDKLQGNWYVVSSQLNGKKPDPAAPVKLVVVGQTMTIHYGPKAGKEPESCFLKIDLLANPKKIDIFPPMPGYQQPGVFRWQGDNLELCWGERLKVADDGKVIANAESSRPKGFDSKNASLLLLSRTKPGAKAEKGTALPRGTGFQPVTLPDRLEAYPTKDFSTALLQLRR